MYALSTSPFSIDDDLKQVVRDTKKEDDFASLADTRPTLIHSQQTTNTLGAAPDRRMTKVFPTMKCKL